MKMQFVGMKHVKFTKDGVNREFYNACFLSPMQDRDLKNGSVGQDVHTPSIPDRYKDILNESNIGKEFDVEFYYLNKYEYIAYCALASK